MSETLQTLRSLEAKYLNALDKVRSLIEMEGGTPSGQSAPLSGLSIADSHKPSLTQDRPEVRKILRTFPLREPKPFSKLPKAEAARVVMEASGSDLRKDDIFAEMKKRGHGITSLKALVVSMSSSEHFVSRGRGMWGLAAGYQTKDQPLQNS